jgi:peptidoglycan/xylan/chitin deacetylase (PgdA/CDA1 family)
MSALTTHPLEALLQQRWAVRLSDSAAQTTPQVQTTEPGGDVRCALGQGERRWLRSGDWRVYARTGSASGDGERLATFTCADGSQVHATVDEAGSVNVPFSFADAYDAYVSEDWRDASENRRLSPTALNAFYKAKALIPRRVQLAARRRLIRLQGVPEFPAWPSDPSVSRLLAFFAGCTLRAAGLQEGAFRWFWPETNRAAVILTHDVESEDGIRRVLALADLEEEHGFRSSFNFGAWYDIDPGILSDLTARGFEVGMHGLTHDRQLFASRAAFEERLPALTRLAASLGAVGFRSPATHRVFSWLAELPVEYDCTLPNSDPYEPQPGGCCSIWPFMIGPVVELPYTLPQDHTLLTLLGRRTPSLWLEQAVALAGQYGLIQCVSHPDAGYLGDADKRAIYSDFLAGLAEQSDLWRALPREVAAWWRWRASAPDSADAGFSTGFARLSDGVDVEFSPPGDANGRTTRTGSSPDGTTGIRD